MRQLDLCTPHPATPSDVYGDLLAEVQMRQIFPDGKTFVDALPRHAPAQIMASFPSVERTPDAIARFVADNFLLPAPTLVPHARSGLPLREHIRSLWPLLTRQPEPAHRHSSLLALHQPFIVPGGRFRELYYWDTYFTMLGLLRDGLLPLARGMIDSFVSLIEDYGHVPNGTRSYYLSRSQPPMLAAMMVLIPPADMATNRRWLQALIREHGFWMAGKETLAPGECTLRVVRMLDGSYLNRYWDGRDTPRDESYREDVLVAQTTPRPEKEVFRELRAGAESGWDYSSRWLNDSLKLSSIRTTRIVPVDLNAFLFKLEHVIAHMARQVFERDCADRFATYARQREAAVTQYLWSDEMNCFADYHIDFGRALPSPTAAMLAPLFAGLATQAQADRTAARTEDCLLAPGGLRTTLIQSGEQWDWPNGWAPLQWIAIKGLQRYGHVRLAREIARRWCATVQRSYAETGYLHEKYDVEECHVGGGGEYLPQLGFGWTNGVTAALLDQLAEESRA
nr:alpha,alpha-trehalase TreF [uncultured Hyphomonas sp.]